MSEALEELNESDIDYIIAQKKAKLADLAKKSRKRDLYKGVVVAGAGSLGLLAKNSTMFSPRQSYYIGLASYGTIGYGALLTTSAITLRDDASPEFTKESLKILLSKFYKKIELIIEGKIKTGLTSWEKIHLKGGRKS